MVVLAVIALAAVSGAFAVQQRDAGSTGTGSDDRIAIASATSFDPQGNNGAEQEDLVPNAVDGDPATAWRSERYRDPESMAGKDGVGLVVTLDEVSDIGQVDVRAPEGGWSAQVYVVQGDPPTDLAGWGAPLASVQSAKPGLTRFAPVDGIGDHVLVWFTRTPDSGEMAVSEIAVRQP